MADDLPRLEGTAPSAAGKKPVSMTGYARTEGSADNTTWVWDLKSVNGKSLDVRVRLPSGWDRLEPKLRQQVAAKCQRGSISVALDLRRRDRVRPVAINRAFLEQIFQLQRELRDKVDQSLPRLEGLLALRGAIEAEETGEEQPTTDEALDAALLADFDRALAAFADGRAEEGAKLTAVLSGHLDAIAVLTDGARVRMAELPTVFMDRVTQQLQTLLEGAAGAAERLPPERLAQEVAILAARADATEEIDRLAAHVQAARDLLDSGGAIGRRLDFLSQEMHREANTLGSKSGDLAMTRFSLDLKHGIEQFREQVQNIE